MTYENTQIEINKLQATWRNADEMQTNLSQVAN